MQRLHSTFAAVLTAVYLALALGAGGAHRHAHRQVHGQAHSQAGLQAGHHHTAGCESVSAALLNGASATIGWPPSAPFAINALDSVPATGHTDCPACWLEQHAQPALLPVPAFAQPCFAGFFSPVRLVTRPDRRLAHQVSLAHPATGPPAARR